MTSAIGIVGVIYFKLSVRSNSCELRLRLRFNGIRTLARNLHFRIYEKKYYDFTKLQADGKNSTCGCNQRVSGFIKG
jgi:hypothetical protein